MFNYHCLNPISDVGLEEFTEEYVPVSGPVKADALLVRSAVMLEMELPATVKAIARAGAGVNNIPLDRCTEEGIVVFNTPGANANGVKELVITGMLLASRDIIGGINWVEENEEDGNIAKDAEKAKKQFAGCELDGKKLTEFPFTDVLDDCKPVFEKIKGWNCDISKCRKKEDLPKEALDYIRMLEKACECKIRYVSVGAERDAYIEL